MTNSSLRLVVVRGPAMGREAALAERAVSLGRSSEAGLVLGGDDFVSDVHAEVVPTPAGPLLRNFSPNGTRVNDVAVIKDVVLKAGDRLGLGSDYELEVRAPGAVPAPRRAEPPTASRPAAPAPRPGAARRAVEPAAAVPVARRGLTRKQREMAVVLGVWVAMGAFFGWVLTTTEEPLPSLAEVRVQEAAWGQARSWPEAETRRVLELLDLAQVHVQRGDRGSAREVLREAMAVRRPPDPESPAWRYAARRLGQLQGTH